MRKFWAVVAVIVLVTVLFLVFRSKNPSPENPPAQNGTVSGTDSNSPSGAQKVPSVLSTAALPNSALKTDIASRAASPNPAPGEATNEQPAVLPPLTVLDHVRVVMHNYAAVFGENPVGTNPEITAALMGKNPKQINFVTPDSGLRVNEKGEMVDAYGTPFFFHQISGKEMEIRSAGEDRTMWTFDDLVTR
jgi:hypothetical protein